MTRCSCPADMAPVKVKEETGRPLVEGRRITSFTDAEERTAGLENVVPFLLESRIRSLGAHFECAAEFHPFALADGLLVTGQNPASSALTAPLTLQAIRVAN
jgi:putative intracellular protease/amidase